MYQRILVAVDGSPTGKLGLEEAVEMAREQNGNLLIVHVVDPFVFWGDISTAAYAGDLLSVMRESGREVLKEAEDWAQKHGVTPKTALLETISHSTADLIVTQARKWRADLIVLGTHGRRGVRRLVLGSDAEAVVRTAPVPVLLVRARESPRAKGRVVPQSVLTGGAGLAMQHTRQ